MQYVSAILKGGGENAYIYAKEEKNILLYSGHRSSMILSPIFLAKTLFSPFIVFHV